MLVSYLALQESQGQNMAKLRGQAIFEFSNLLWS